MPFASPASYTASRPYADDANFPMARGTSRSSSFSSGRWWRRGRRLGRRHRLGRGRGPAGRRRRRAGAAGQGSAHLGVAPARGGDRLAERGVGLPDEGTAHPAAVVVGAGRQLGSPGERGGELLERVGQQRQRFPAAGVGDHPAHQLGVDSQPGEFHRASTTVGSIAGSRGSSEKLRKVRSANAALATSRNSERIVTTTHSTPEATAGTSTCAGSRRPAALRTARAIEQAAADWDGSTPSVDEPGKHGNARKPPADGRSPTATGPPPRHCRSRSIGAPGRRGRRRFRGQPTVRRA